VVSPFDGRQVLAPNLRCASCVAGARHAFGPLDEPLGTYPNRKSAADACTAACLRNTGGRQG
jgi:hypothetical protein